MRTEQPAHDQLCKGYGKNALAVRDACYCKLQGVGHVWPGGRYGTPCALPFSKVCVAWKEVMSGSADGFFLPYDRFQTNARLLDFFLLHRRR